MTQNKSLYKSAKQSQKSSLEAPSKPRNKSKKLANRSPSMKKTNLKQLVNHLTPCFKSKNYNYLNASHILNPHISSKSPCKPTLKQLSTLVPRGLKITHSQNKHSHHGEFNGDYSIHQSLNELSLPGSKEYLKYLTEIKSTGFQKKHVHMDQYVKAKKQKVKHKQLDLSKESFNH